MAGAAPQATGTGLIVSVPSIELGLLLIIPFVVPLGLAASQSFKRLRTSHRFSSRFNPAWPTTEGLTDLSGHYRDSRSDREDRTTFPHPWAAIVVTPTLRPGVSRRTPIGQNPLPLRRRGGRGVWRGKRTSWNPRSGFKNRAKIRRHARDVGSIRSPRRTGWLRPTAGAFPGALARDRSGPQASRFAGRDVVL